MTPEQALLAAEAGAKYVSPFAGRIDDFLRERLGMDAGRNFMKSDYWPADGDLKKLFKISEDATKLTLESDEKKNLNQRFHIGIENIVKDSPHKYRFHDNGIYSGVDLVAKTVDILKDYKDVKVIAASIRNPRQVREVALAGAHIATIPFKVLDDIFYHKKTCEGAKKFKEDVVPEYEALF
ncbi:MAG: hypothetical protein JSW73_02645 [Candidatus Woesearchaeota archaeon]|nr:MAG: hypothetical protein JSW73_02645 [Candidatus Woesearchaeota archaeon]